MTRITIYNTIYTKAMQSNRPLNVFITNHTFKCTLSSRSRISSRGWLILNEIRKFMVRWERAQGRAAKCEGKKTYRLHVAASTSFFDL